MIKVNLLKTFSQTNVEVIKEQEEANNLAIEVFKRLFIIIIGPAAMYFYQDYNITELTSKRDQIQAELVELQTFNQKKDPTAQEILKYEEDKKKLNKQTLFLQRVSKDRKIEPELISSIKKIIPKGVWIGQLNVQGFRVEVNGFGDNEKAISQFETGLISLKIFKNVRLEDVTVETNNSSQSEKLKNLVIRSFVLKAQLDVEEASKLESSGEF